MKMHQSAILDAIVFITDIGGALDAGEAGSVARRVPPKTMISTADSQLGLNGSLVSYMHGREVQLEPAPEMNPSEWDAFLNQRFAGRNWQRWFGKTPTAIYSVVVVLETRPRRESDRDVAGGGASGALPGGPRASLPCGDGPRDKRVCSACGEGLLPLEKRCPKCGSGSLAAGIRQSTRQVDAALVSEREKRLNYHRLPRFIGRLDVYLGTVAGGVVAWFLISAAVAPSLLTPGRATVALLMFGSLAIGAVIRSYQEAFGEGGNPFDTDD